MSEPSAPVRVAGLLGSLHQTVAVAESLTGGAVQAELVAVPGVSSVFRGGIVAYATELKHDLLDVPAELLRRDGPVAATTAVAMARGVARRCGADWGVATTGVAGPDPQDGHPPGTVFVAVSGPVATKHVRLALTGDRAAVRAASVAAALDLLEDQLRAG